MKVSVSVMAHPERRERAEQLAECVGAPIFWDLEGPASGNSDRVWRTARGAWELHDPSADYHLVLQDDAIVSADLLPGVERMLGDFAPTLRPLVSLYFGTGGSSTSRADRTAALARQQNASWIRSDRLFWGVAIMLPTNRIREMITYANQRVGVPDDMRIAGWAKFSRTEVWYPLPSLVDHALVPSLTKHRARDRHAHWFHPGSSLTLPWDGPVLTDPMLARDHPTRSGPASRRRERVSSAERPGTGKVGNGA